MLNPKMSNATFMKQDSRRKRKPTGRYPGLRSFDNRLFSVEVPVRFFNTTHRQVDVLWVDYQQNCTLYKSLKPREHYDVFTYVGHPWIFEDSLTRDPMVVNGNEIWWPSPLPRKPGLLCIKYPLQSLQSLASRAVRDQLHCVAFAMKLDLPAVIREDIVMLMKTMYYHKNREFLNWDEEPPTQKPTDELKHRLVLVALKLYDVLFDVKEMNVSIISLMSIQVFLQWVQNKINPHHVSIQALIKVFQTFLDDEETWLEVDPLLIEHASELVHRLIKLIDVHSSVNSCEDVLQFVHNTTMALISKYGKDRGEV